MAAITIGLVLVSGLYGKATLVNIRFNSRCLTEVIVVWAAGRWLQPDRFLQAALCQPESFHLLGTAATAFFSCND